MPHTVYLSLGSNLGDRAARIREAVDRLSALGEVARVSSLYETAPVEVTDQPWFLNAAIELRTELAPDALLAAMLDIERAMGRHRTQPKGPRIIDLDILFYDDLQLHTPSLDIPHPALHLRRFVLAPLAEIAAEARHPLLEARVRELLARLRSEDEVHLFSSSPAPK